ncbi:MAG: hypothetical protein H7Y88_06150, partial [Phycisphaerales bacterium]|nr:hypothetical protein [Phycisphaerales bacterium]
PPPLNDSCASAFEIGNGSTSFFTTSATTDGPAETLCAGFGDSQVGADIWYTYTPGCDGPVSIDTCGSAFDTRLAVYTGACPVAPNTAMQCNDDNAGACGPNSLQSGVSFAGVGGTTYLIRVGGYDGGGGPETGAGTLTIAGPNCGPAVPENNECADAAPIGYGTHEFTNVGSTTDGPAACGEIANDVWFAFTACGNGTITVQTCNNGTGYDSVLAAYTGACGNLTQRACNDDFCGLQSRITFNGVQGTQYLIRVGGYAGELGSGNIAVSGPACAAPPNDTCNNRIGIALGSTNFSTLNATTDGPAHAACDFFGSSQITNDIWYNHPASCTGVLTVETCGATYDSKIAVYDGNGCESLDSRIMACNDDSDGCGAGSLQSRLTVNIVAGQNYTIRVGGFDGDMGTGALTLACTSTPTDCNENGTPDVTEIAANPSLDCFDQDAPPINGFFTRGAANGELDACECSANWNRDGSVGSADITAFLGSWFNDLTTAQTKADFNCSGVTGSADITAFLNVWFQALSGLPPFNGCP